MNNRNYKEKTNKFSDLLLAMCQRWRSLLICMVIGAVVVGAFGWWRSGDSNASQQGIVNVSQITDERKSFIEETADQIVADNEILSIQKEYMDNSLLMNMNPFQIYSCSLCFIVGNDLDFESSETKISNIQNCISILKSTQFKEDINNELIGAEKRNKFNDCTELISINSDEQDMGILKIDVFSSDQNLTSEMAGFIKESMPVITNQQERLVRENTLLTADFTIFDKQKIVLKRIEDLENEISRLGNAISHPNEKLYLQRLLKDRMGESAVTIDDDAVVIVARKLSVKNILLGALIGLLAAAACIFIRYTFSNTIKTDNDFEICFGAKIIGRVEGTTHFNKKRHTSLDKWINNVRNRKKTRLDKKEMIDVITTKILIESEKQALHDICVVIDDGVTSDIDFLDSLIEKIGDRVDIKMVNNIMDNPEEITKMASSDGVILVEQLNQSKWYDIKRCFEMCDSYRLRIIGGIILE